DVPAPIRRQHTVRCVPMEAAVRPIANASRQPMFDRVEMDVVNVALQVRLAADCVLPIAPLPDPLVALCDLAGRTRTGARKHAREAALDQTPTRWVVGVPDRQLPDCMDVIRKDADCDRCKWMMLLNPSVRGPKRVDIVDQRFARAIGQGHSEKECSA